MSKGQISVSNIGPIEKLVIPVPDNGGVVVLRGCQGSGKSTALKAIAATASGQKADVGLRDGATRGAVEWGGAKLSVTKSRTARTGELEVETIEGRYDISALVDPLIRDPERADAVRIKQLIAMTGAKADPGVYHTLLGKERYQSLAIDDNTDDPIELFGRVVRSLQQNARTLEKHANDTRVADVDVPSVSDELSVDDARKAVRDAENHFVTLQSRASERRAYEDRIAGAKSQLQQMQSEYTGGSVDDAKSAVEKCSRIVAEYADKLEHAKRELASANAVLSSAQQHYDAVSRFDSILQAAKPVAVSDDELSAAENDVELANKALVDAIGVKQARDAAEKAKEANAKADSLAAEAELLRKKASEAESVLAKILPTSELRVVDGRIVVSTDRSKNELYADLSHGERAILAIRTAAKHIPKGGVATISQEMWAAISPENKNAISQEAKALGVVILTAEVTDGDLEVVME